MSQESFEVLQTLSKKKVNCCRINVALGVGSTAKKLGVPRFLVLEASPGRISRRQTVDCTK